MKKKNKLKGYAYGSMVRKPMYGGGMAMSANPMMDRKNKMGMMGMANGGEPKKEAKKFAALAPPFDKATYADKIAGATKKA